MSVESQQLGRAALEGKDRDELLTIASAMGGKPGSRAKKADIVDLILELAGVTTSDATPSDDAVSDTDTKPRRGRGRGKAADESSTGPEGSPAGEAPEPAADDQGEIHEAEAPAARAEEVRADEARVDRGPSEPRRGEQPGGQRGRNERRPGEPGRAQGNRQGQHANQPENEGNQRDSQGNQQDSQGNQQDSQGNQQDSQGNQQNADDAEPGNRRRRRRGRDRGDRPGPAQGPEETWQGEPVEVDGLLDLRDEGYGFLRLRGYLPSKDDVYVSVKQVRQFSLRRGDQIKGASRPAGRNEKNPALLRIDEVNGMDPEQAKARPRFEDLTPLFPDAPLRLEVSGDPLNMTARIVDLVSPIGKGQRGLIVSPPKAGKTTVMKQIARSIETNNPEVHLIVLLVDERPEEVTDMRRWVQAGEVAASTFDRPAEEHTIVSELVIERAKRLVEQGRDVVIILDGITRLARAYNLAAPATGRIMSGGIDTGALYPPKKFFGAARNVEEGGSLTILATALIETGSKMDEVIFEEFKGTGNMELRLDRRLAERRIYPAIDVDGSSTRHEELLFDRKQLQMVWKLRRVLSGLGEGGGGAGLEMLIDRLAGFKSNDEFLAEVAKAPATGV